MKKIIPFIPEFLTCTLPSLSLDKSIVIKKKKIKNVSQSKIRNRMAKSVDPDKTKNICLLSTGLKQNYPFFSTK